MAVIVTCSDPKGLLEAIKRSIREGQIDTWQHRDGYFTHSPAQWRSRAYFKPSIMSGGLLLNIIRPKGQNVSSEVYAIYHGRFIEALLAHFDRMFDSASSTALASPGDLV